MRRGLDAFVWMGLVTISGVAACNNDQPLTFAVAGAGGNSGSGTGLGGTQSAGKGTGATTETTLSGDMTLVSSGPASGGPGGGAKPCAEGKAFGQIAPANILFVIDRSGSMNCNAPPIQTSTACELLGAPKDPSKPTKWQIVANALKNAVAKLPASTSAGIVYFASDDKCGVSSTPAVALAKMDANQIAAMKASIGAVVPKSKTPIVGGLTLGYKHLYEDVNIVGNEFVVLLTDGAETCAPQLQEDLVTKTVKLAASVKIRTFVIGVPGSEPARSLLSRIAFEGGTASDPACKHEALPIDVGNCHFDLTDPNVDLATELTKALAALSGAALTCEFPVPLPEPGVDADPDKVNVSFKTGMMTTVDFLKDNKACAMANGWQYSADKTKIILCGAACDKVKADVAGSIVITLGCEDSVEVPQ